MDFDVLCVGQAGLDAIIGGADLEDFATTTRESTRVTGGIHISTGGDAANESAVLVRLGWKAGIVSEVNDDVVGRLVRDILIDKGVDTTYLAVSPRGPVDSVPNLVFVMPDASRKFLGMKVERSRLKEIPFDESILDSIKVLSLASMGGEPLVGEEGISYIRRITKRAKEAGAYVCADVLATEWRVDPRIHPEMFEYIDFLFPNDYEALTLTGAETIEEAADIFLATGLGTVIIKTGKEGCYVKTKNGESFTVPTYTDLKAIDTTGAGDNFAAGFISALCEGKDLYDCCKFGHATASISVTSYGTTSGVKSREQVEELISKYE
jgi:sugar/nucleoside kinase (ribokinase family)